MKTKLFFISLLVGIIYFSCEDDELDNIGMDMRPPQDYIALFDTIMNFEASTIKLDSVYAKTIESYLGSFYDTEFGEVKAGYACQFVASRGFDLDNMVGDQIDSINLDILFYTYTGDSLTPMEVTAYPITKPLVEDYYSDIDFSEFYDTSKVWGKKTYTARDLTISDLVNDSLIKYGYAKSVTVSLSKEEGQRFLEEYKKNKSFGSRQDFVKFFPGLYIESTFGTGNVLNVEGTAVSVYYQKNYTFKDSEDKDSIGVVTDFALFQRTTEVIQLNSFETTNNDQLLAPNDDTFYLKTPAGVYAKLTLPLSQIRKHIGNRMYSSVSFSLEAYPKQDWKYALDFPGDASLSASSSSSSSSTSVPRLLLVLPDSVKTFFEKRKCADGRTSFTTNYSAATNTYEFTNISNLIHYAIENIDDENADLDLLLIPILVESAYSSSSGSYRDNVSFHYLRPSGVALKKGGDNLQLKIVASDLEINK